MKAGALTGTGGAGTQPGTGSDAWRSVDDGHLHLERSMDRIPGLEAGDVLDGDARNFGRGRAVGQARDVGALLLDAEEALDGEDAGGRVGHAAS